MRIVLNGSERSVDGPRTVARLLDELGVERRGTAVVRGGAVLPREAWDRTPLEEGDRLEIVRMVGGG